MVEIIIGNGQVLKLVLAHYGPAGEIVAGLPAGFSQRVFAVQNQRAAVIGARAVSDKVLHVPRTP